MDIKIYRVRIKLEEPLLGSSPKNKEVYKTFIASKAADLAHADEEVATIEEVEERGWTGFHTDDAGPFLYDYQIKGFLKEAARTLKQYGPLKQLRDKIERYVFVMPRKIRLPEICEEPLERPLRAQTAQGPRTTVVRSDVVAAGAVLSFELHNLTVGGVTYNCLREVLGYGQYIGLGQWRSASFGRISVVEFEEI